MIGAVEADCSGGRSVLAIRDQGGGTEGGVVAGLRGCVVGERIGSALKPAAATGRYERCR